MPTAEVAAQQAEVAAQVAVQTVDAETEIDRTYYTPEQAFRMVKEAVQLDRRERSGACTGAVL